jgi:hypothetical protein
MRQVSRPVRRGAGRKGRKDLARSLPSFNVLEVLFLGEVFSAFLPSKKTCWTHQFRHWGLANSIRAVLRLYAHSPSARMAQRVLTLAGSRHTMALPSDIYSKHARIVHALPEEPPRARGTGDLGPAKAASPVLFVGLWTFTGLVWSVF